VKYRLYEVLVEILLLNNVVDLELGIVRAGADGHPKP
jgi:hypothetical protein